MLVEEWKMVAGLTSCFIPLRVGCAGVRLFGESHTWQLFSAVRWEIQVRAPVGMTILWSPVIFKPFGGPKAHDNSRHALRDWLRFYR